MTVGEVFLESLSSGVITEHEISWVASHQGAFARHEEALALRLGRLVDESCPAQACAQRMDRTARPAPRQSGRLCLTPQQLL
jgi:hypothetical protein